MVKSFSSRLSPNFVSTQVTEARRYYFDLNPKPHRELMVVCGGCERMRADYLIQRPGFPFLTIEFVAEGAGSLELAGVSYRLAPGMVFAYGPNVPHVIRNDSDRPMLKYYVSIAGKDSRPLLERSSLPAGSAVQLSSPRDLADLFELLQREGGSEHQSAPQICAALLPVLILKINESAIAYCQAEPRALQTYQRVKRIIERRFEELRSVEEISLACHVDPSYLCRLFQRFARTTPYRVLTRLKMNRAAEMLLDERLLVKEVASALKFADAYHFSRLFRRTYGLSPQHFVRQCQSGQTFTPL